jgi:hypothetical protein
MVGTMVTWHVDRACGKWNTVEMMWINQKVTQGTFQMSMLDKGIII